MRAHFQFNLNYVKCAHFISSLKFERENESVNAVQRIKCAFSSLYSLKHQFGCALPPRPSFSHHPPASRQLLNYLMHTSHVELFMITTPTRSPQVAGREPLRFMGKEPSFRKHKALLKPYARPLHIRRSKSAPTTPAEVGAVHPSRDPQDSIPERVRACVCHASPPPRRTYT